MAISFTEATRTLLNGKKLAWEKFGEHKGGSITLGTPQQRRLFAFLLSQDLLKVAQGHEDLFTGLIAAWKEESADPAAENLAPLQTAESDAWRLDRIEASGFGGLTIFGGTPFDLQINGENWCLEGQNGSGKTSLVSAILWALTGKRIREQDGPIDERGTRSVVNDNGGRKIGEWPSFASYPVTAVDLVKPVDVWVRLTFKNSNGDMAIAHRQMACPSNGFPTVQANIDPRLLTSPQLIETGLLMPARITRIGFGEKSQSLYDAVKMLTGLDQLADVADGCGQFTHAARKFLRYGKDNGMEVQREKFEESLQKAEVKAHELKFALPEAHSLGDKDLVKNLKETVKNALAEAATHLATLKTEISLAVDTAMPEGRQKVKNAVAAARAVVNQGTKGIAVFEAWNGLNEASQCTPFVTLPDAIGTAREKLDAALLWHRRQSEDATFRLKALAAQSFVRTHEHDGSSLCPLCNSELLSEKQRALASELAEIKKDAKEAERKIDDVCRSLESELLKRLPSALRQHRELLGRMDPSADYESVILERFCDGSAFADVLTGLSSRIKVKASQQRSELPAFSFPPFAYEELEPQIALELRGTLHELERLIALTNWWSQHRPQFRATWISLVGKRQANDVDPADSMEGELDVLEKALLKAEPLDELAKHLLVAVSAAEQWAIIRKEQDRRESIATALEPLKQLRLLVAAETACSIVMLSGRIKAILKRIHLHERLSYESAFLGKKAVHVAGQFEPGMQIDAALVANTSWLRAILWAFVLALREETIEKLGSNPFPLIVLDDPQTTFDPRNKRKWAEEIARLANLGRNSKEGIQLLLTTHERQFFQCMMEHEKLSGECGLIGGVNKTCGVATIVNGSCLERVWKEALDGNDDARARDYIADVRIYCEDLLKFMLRGEGPDIANLSLDALKLRLKRLHDTHVPPFDRKAFTDLLNTLCGGGGKSMKLINDAHHKDDESLGLAEARDVKEFWEKTLLGQVHDAFAVFDRFESFYGEPRAFPWAKNVVKFPEGFKDEVRAVKFRQTGIAAAAKSDGYAGDGVVTVEEWETATEIILSNHEVYQLASGTLDPVAALGDLLIVCSHAEVHSRNLVVATFGKSLLARRFSRMEAHPNIFVLTGQSVDPFALPEPVIASPESAHIRKIVGTIFASHMLPPPMVNEDQEFVPLENPNILRRLLDDSRLFRVRGRSAEPIALDGQSLITRAVKAPDQIRALDRRPIVAVDEEGTHYFKRLCCSGSVAVLESLNPDGTTASEVLSFDGSLGFPRLVHALEVIGVIFDLP